MAKRISDLDLITDEAIDLSQFLPIDDPTQSFKMTMLQLSDFLFSRHMEALYPVGSTVYRVDNIDPITLGYPGTWTKVAENVTIATGLNDGTDRGTIAGTNHPAVPLLQHNHTATTTASQASHSHTATQAAHSHGAYQDAHTHSASQAAHSHTATTDSQGSHAHNVQVRIQSRFCVNGQGWPASSTGGDNGAAAEHHANENWGPVTDSTGAHAHNLTTAAATPAISVVNAQPAVHVDAQTPAITVGSTAPAISAATTVNNNGVASPTIDVQGTHLNGALWIRTA